MKSLICIFLLVSNYVFSQETIDLKHMLGCTNIGSSEAVTHYIYSTGEVWHYSGGTFYTGGVYNSSLVTVGNADLHSDDWPGYNFSWLFPGGPYWSLGLYKVTNSKQPNKYFYLDARDSDFGKAIYLPDFYIYFDNSLGAYKYRSNNEAIAQGEIVRIWDIHGELPNTSELQNYWGNTLAVTKSGDNYIRIVWGPYQERGGEEIIYYIYRATSSTPTPPPIANFSYIASVPSNSYEYIDNYYFYGDAIYVHYYVKAKFVATESFSAATNIASAHASLAYKIIEDNNSCIGRYELNQNFPNPFNPATTITYSVAEKSLISLKVYDVLGNEITELEREVKEPGIYSISFDASRLSSGIYFYTLKANGYSLTKKMLLSK